MRCRPEEPFHNQRARGPTRRGAGLRHRMLRVQILPCVPFQKTAMAAWPNQLEAIDLKSMSWGCNSLRGYHSDLFLEFQPDQRAGVAC